MSTEDEPLIELHDVSLHYRRQRSLRGLRDHQVLSEVSFPVYPGETVGLIGRNGAGKTSLLKLIAGIISADAGSIVRRTENICLLSYQLGFNQFLSGRENAVHTAMLQGMARTEIEFRIDQVAAFAGLEDAIDEPLSSYSAGMRARLGFAVSLQLDPDVLLIDEALGVGDHEFKERSGRAMRERMRSNKTVVVVSHDPFTVKELCDRAVWIENGRVVLQDIPEKVIEAYHDFDRVVADMSLATGRPETYIRSNPFNVNPIEFMQRLRLDMKHERNKMHQQYFADSARGQASGVEMYVPQRRPVLSNLVAQECGNWCWVENCHQVQSGSRQAVERAYQKFERTLYKLGMEVKLDPVKLRSTDLYRQLVSLLHELTEDNR
jgi:lipopolysaccharide transport system ATP-binding protein